MRRLTVSIVTYCPERRQLAETMGSLRMAASRLDGFQIMACLVDNTPLDRTPEWLSELAVGYDFSLKVGHGNIGFGCGHNLLLGELGDYHLVLNPDVEMAPDALLEALAFMESNPGCGLLTPAAFWPDGSRQYLCKRFPAVFDLLLRGFAPAFIKRLFKSRLERYEMRDVIGDGTFWDPPIVSGCFMLFRADVFRKLKGFDPRYFLYFEDFDLSLRVAEVSRTAYVPAVRIVHHGGHAARKGLRHIRMFAASARTFFDLHGWRWL